MNQARIDVRGFHAKSPQTSERLETVGRSFLIGYGAAAEARHVLDAEATLEELPAFYRGLAYEGAAMGFAIRDGLPLGGSNHVREFLTGRAANHVYMAYVGVGWAMARLPRLRWNTLHAPDPLLRWVVLDGYGFHQAYFKTRRLVREQHRQASFPWPTQQYGDYAAPGLAATYAGGATREELERFRDLAGPYQAYLAQGAAFGATTRVAAGLVVPDTAIASQVFCAMSPDEVAEVALEAATDLPKDGSVPAYEVWRQRIIGRYQVMTDL
jgi:hypothetical protein